MNRAITNSAITRGLAIATLLAALGASGRVQAHEEHQHDPQPVVRNPATILELDAARQATARFLDVEQATKEGYVDIGLFIPKMGWHYMKEQLVDDQFQVEKPELLVYADDPCGGKRRLVAVEYAIPLELSKRAPKGYIGRADSWDANQQFQLWTLHAWVWEYNPDGVFAGLNPRVQ
jgi:hypothetical protein